jgi:hypothetical protein
LVALLLPGRPLPTPGRAHDDHHRLRSHPFGQRLDIGLPAEVHLGVLSGERLRAPVRVLRDQQVVDLLLPRGVDLDIDGSGILNRQDRLCRSLA